MLFLIFLFLLVVGLLSPFYLAIRYGRKGSNDEFVLTLRGPFFTLTYQLPVVQLVANKKEPQLYTQSELKLNQQAILHTEKKETWAEVQDYIEQARALVRKYQGIINFLLVFLRGPLDHNWLVKLGYPWLGLLLGMLKLAGRRVAKFEWITRIGVGDAAQTALVTGIFWGIKSATLGLLRKELRFGHTRPQIEVQPEFNHQRFDLHFYCIFKLSLGHIIITGLGNLTDYVWQKGVLILGRATN